MMRKRTKRAAAALAGLVAAASAAAQDTDAEAEPTRRYRVEFIVFAHQDLGAVDERLETAASAPPAEWTVPERRRPFGLEAGTGEFGEPAFGDGAAGSAGGDPAARPGPGTSEAEGAPPVSGPGADTTSDLLPPIELFGPPGFAGRERWFEPLADEALDLGATRRRLERLDAYRVLAHAGWEQDAVPEAQARPVRLAELGIANPSGTLTLFVSRYVHLIADLGYRTDAVAADAPAAAGARDGRAPAGEPFDDDGPEEDRARDPFGDDAAGGGGNTREPFGSSGRAADESAGGPFGTDPGAPRSRARDEARASLTRIRTTPSYVLEARRRARTGELHYVDHPLYGILFIITEAPAAEEDDASRADGLEPAA